MKFVLIACFVLIGAAYAQYDYQQEQHFEPAVEISHQPEQEYLPPAAAGPADIGADYAEEVAPAAELADDGYRYRTVKKFKYRTLRRRV